MIVELILTDETKIKSLNFVADKNRELDGFVHFIGFLKISK